MISIRYLFALSIALVACDRTTDRSLRNSPSLLTLDSVQLRETDSLYLASPVHVTVSPSGALFVSDTRNGHVLQFSADGTLLRRFGKRGEGPGELGTPMATAMLGDSILAVADVGRAQLALFDVRSSAFLRSTPLTGMPYTMKAVGDTILIGAVNPPSRTSLALWWPAADSVIHRGPLPGEYLEAWPLLANHPFAAVAPLGDSILLGFTGHGPLFLTRWDGSIVDTVPVPAVRRRGVPSDIVQRFAKPLNNTEIAGMLSSLLAMHRLSSGEVAVFHLDLNFSGGSVTGDGFLSVLSKDLRQACVDARVQTSPDGRASVAFRGDTLFSVEQHIVSDMRAATYVKRYVIDTSHCR